MTTNLPFLRWLLAHPAFRDGALCTAFLTEHPPLSPPAAAARRPLAGPWRLNLPTPPPAPRRTSRSGSCAMRPVRRPVRPGADAGHGSSGARRAGRARSGPPGARRARGDEDGAPRHLAFRGRGQRGHVAAGDQVAGGAVLVSSSRSPRVPRVDRLRRGCPVGHPACEQVHEPDHDHDADIRPEAVDHVGRDPFASPTIAILITRRRGRG